MRKALKSSWSKHMHESRENMKLLEEGAFDSMFEQIKILKPSVSVQVIREWAELDLKHKEDYCIVDVIGSYQNEKFIEAMEWIVEAEKFIQEVQPELIVKGNMENSLWCHNMLMRIRKMRAKRSPNLTFQRGNNVGSSSSSSPLSLREELYCEITSLVNVNYGLRNVVHSMPNIFKVIEDSDLQRINEVEQFLGKIKEELEEKIPETNSDWYHNKISETRALTDKWDPEFSLQSQDVGLTPLHEELHCQVRLLANIISVDVLVTFIVPKVQHQAVIMVKYMKEVQESVAEMDKFIKETMLQLVEKNYQKNSDWYRNKIAESRTLTTKRYSAFPLQSQDHVGYAKDKHQIFLSFRGGDTRKGFTNYLYEALRNEGFNVFRDNEGLKRGDSISQVLVGEIEKSKVSIIIFSKNYADSRWCLDEVNKILECKEKNGQLIWPIFYKVEPTDVRNQKNSYAVAMSKQEEKFGKDSEKVKKWRSSLSQIADLKALEYKENDDRPESDIIKEIIKDANEFLKEVSRKH